MATLNMSEALGRRVVATDSAEDIGEIKNFIIDRAGRNITKVHVVGRKKNAELLEWSSLQFGPDVVMATSGSDVVEVQQDRDLDSVKGNIDYFGARVLDTNGFEHGTVTEVEFDPSDGSIVRVHGEAPIDVERVRSLGTYAVVIDAAR